MCGNVTGSYSECADKNINEKEGVFVHVEC